MTQSTIVGQGANRVKARTPDPDHCTDWQVPGRSLPTGMDPKQLTDPQHDALAACLAQPCWHPSDPAVTLRKIARFLEATAAMADRERAGAKPKRRAAKWGSK